MDVNKMIILVTPEQYRKMEEQMMLFESFGNSYKIFDKRRECLAKEGISSFWFKGIPAVNKKIKTKKYKYIDLKKSGNKVADWIKQIYKIIEKEK